MQFNEIEAEFFEYTESDNSQFQDMLQVLDNMLRDLKLGSVESREHDKAKILVKAEEFERAYLLLENRVALRRMMGLISFSIARGEDNKIKRTEIKGAFDERGNFIKN